MFHRRAHAHPTIPTVDYETIVQCFVLLRRERHFAKRPWRESDQHLRGKPRYPYCPTCVVAAVAKQMHSKYFGGMHGEKMVVAPKLVSFNHIRYGTFETFGGRLFGTKHHSTRLVVARPAPKAKKRPGRTRQELDKFVDRSGTRVDW